MEATYTETRGNFAQLWDRVVDERETLTIHRRGSEDVVLLPAAEFASLQETAHLLRSPKNAKRLLEALMQSIQGEEEEFDTASLRKEIQGS
jgi:antitoxin YefM